MRCIQLTLCLLPLVALSYATAAQSASEADFAKLQAQFLPAEYAGQSNFTLDDAKRMLRHKCQKAAAATDNNNNNGIVAADPNSSYARIEQATVNLLECANEIANLTLVLAEIEAARPRGDLDVVFEKYCAKRPRAERCLRDFNDALLPCLTPAERAQNAVMMRIVTSLLGFICYKNGDQIALFIAEEGPECIETHKAELANCMNATFAAYLPKEGSVAAAAQLQPLPELVMGPRQCIDLRDFEECVLGYLEQCNEITPVNIVESLFRYVKNETKCQSEIDRAAALKLALLEARNGGAASRSAALTTAALLGGLSLVFASYGRLRT